MTNRLAVLFLSPGEGVGGGRERILARNCAEAWTATAVAVLGLGHVGFPAETGQSLLVSAHLCKT